MTKRDYLIIGQGIAGSCLALELLNTEKSFLVVDKHQAGAASLVAQGGINPIVFKRLSPAWKAQEMIPFVCNYYTKLEKQWNKTIFHSKSIYKVIGNEENKSFWQSKINDPELFPFIDNIVENTNSNIHAPYGLGKVNGGGQVDLLLFLEKTRKALIAKQSFKEERIDYSELEIHSQGIKWKNHQFKKVIFCEGFTSANNPFFHWLPFKSTKGSTLQLSLPNLKINYILNKQISLFPQEDGTFICGSSYDWEWDTILPDQNIEKALLEKLRLFVKEKPKVLNHKTGIRPTMKDRRACFGQHPTEKNIYIYNAGGSRGASIYPFFAAEFISYLTQNQSLSKATDIQRFYPLYKK